MSVVPVTGHQRSPSSSSIDATARSTVSWSRSRITSGTPSPLRKNGANRGATSPARPPRVFLVKRGDREGPPGRLEEGRPHRRRHRARADDADLLKRLGVPLVI